MPIPTQKTKDIPKTAKERVYTELRQWIVDGTLHPGEKLSDQEIAQYFSVSRTPVREALQLLSERNLVVISPGKETRVSEINIEETEATYHLMAELNALALEYAMPKIDETVLTELRRINKIIIAPEADAEECDRQFHEVFIRLAANHYLTEFTSILRCQIDRVEHMYYQSSAAACFASHEKILDALTLHDLPRAKDAMRQNWMQTLTKLHL